MPRVTEAHRRARRDEIAEAAVRVLARNGVASTSIAQIVAESGLSAGAIYANFENKAELAHYVAGRLLGWRIDSIDAETEAGAVRTPVRVVESLLSTLADDAPPLSVILQYWGEATIDPELHAVLTDRVQALRAAFERAVRPWAGARGEPDTDALVDRTSTAMIVLCQGYLANSGLLGWMTPQEYLRAATELLAVG